MATTWEIYGKRNDNVATLKSWQFDTDSMSCEDKNLTGKTQLEDLGAQIQPVKPTFS